MAEELPDLAALEADLGDLESVIGSARAMSAAFAGELRAMQASLSAAGREAEGLSRSVGWGLRRAFDGLVFDGQRLSDALRGLGRTMVDSVLTRALKPVQNALGGLIVDGLGRLIGDFIPFADGAAFSQGRVTPFARGGVVSQATRFPMRGGIGLMGEAGPEAILPLARGADGALGVKAGGATRAISITMNIATPDVAGFRRSESQIAARMGRLMARASRNS